MAFLLAAGGGTRAATLHAVKTVSQTTWQPPIIVVQGFRKAQQRWTGLPVGVASVSNAVTH